MEWTDGERARERGVKSDQAPTLVFLQKSRSLQQDSSTTTSAPRLGSMVTAPMEDVNTTRRTVPASAAALITYSVPRTAGSTICSCMHAYARAVSSTYVIDHDRSPAAFAWPVMAAAAARKGSEQLSWIGGGRRERCGRWYLRGRR